MEAIIAIVGFLGTGKTTLLKKIVKEFVDKEWQPNIILNDYENANIDAQDFLSFLNKDQVNALSGSCICCSGIHELRAQINKIPKRNQGVTLIEANGTTDAVSLMGFLGVGMEKHFLPPVQIAVVDVRNWQKRGVYNELEANQVQVSSMIVLNYVDHVYIERVVQVEQDLCELNSKAQIVHWDSFDALSLIKLDTNKNNAIKMEHNKAHWSSCSVELPDPISSKKLTQIVGSISKNILRVKGCTRLDDNDFYSHFERTPTGELYIRPYNGKPVTGPKLLTIGPGSDPEILNTLIRG